MGVCTQKWHTVSAHHLCKNTYQLAYAQRDSLLSMAATVMADGELAGDAKQASLALLPASVGGQCKHDSRVRRWQD
jgi:hypothetical protein